jgi:hypothetical protein
MRCVSAALLEELDVAVSWLNSLRAAAESATSCGCSVTEDGDSGKPPPEVEGLVPKLGRIGVALIGDPAAKVILKFSWGKRETSISVVSIPITSA